MQIILQFFMIIRFNNFVLSINNDYLIKLNDKEYDLFQKLVHVDSKDCILKIYKNFEQNTFSKLNNLVQAHDFIELFRHFTNESIKLIREFVGRKRKNFAIVQLSIKFFSSNDKILQRFCNLKIKFESVLDHKIFLFKHKIREQIEINMIKKNIQIREVQQCFNKSIGDLKRGKNIKNILYNLQQMLAHLQNDQKLNEKMIFPKEINLHSSKTKCCSL